MRYILLTFTRRLKQRGFQSNTKTGVYIMFLAIALRRPRSCSYFCMYFLTKFQKQISTFCFYIQETESSFTLIIIMIGLSNAFFANYMFCFFFRGRLFGFLQT